MKQPAYIFDIDSTLADCTHRLPLIQGENPNWDEFHFRCSDDKPIIDVLRIFNTLVEAQYGIIFVTGRPEMIRARTEEWLKKYCRLRDEFVLLMRENGNHCQDAILKRRIYEQEIYGKYDIVGVFEDRQQCVDMWRSLGLTCFQVAKGDY